MITFFYSIFSALFTGEWQTYTLAEVSTKAEGVWGDVCNLVVNAFGGNFSALQTFTPTTHPFEVMCMVLSFITLVGLSFGVWKIVKAVLSIFFGGLNR